MIIGIKQTPQKGTFPKLKVFYAGHDGAAFRKAHAEMVKQNKGQDQLFSITHPMLTPLQNVAHSTEDHPDVVAAQKKRAQIAAATKKTARQTTLVPETITGESLAGKNKNALLDIAENLRSSGKTIVCDEKSTKAEITTAILEAIKPVSTSPETITGDGAPKIQI